MKKYDSLLLGNGFNCAIENKLVKKVPYKYKYLFSFKAFLLMLKKSKDDYEDGYIEKVRYIEKKSQYASFIDLYRRIEGYVEESPIDIMINIEPKWIKLALGFIRREKEKNEKLQFLFMAAITMGKNQRYFADKLPYKYSSKEKREVNEYVIKFGKMMDDIFFYYNVYDTLQNYYISTVKELEEIRQREYIKYKKRYLQESAILMTTNYAVEMEEYWGKVEYLHGKYVPFSHTIEKDGTARGLSIRRDDGKHFFFFGSSSIDKHYNVEGTSYDGSFFSNNDRDYGTMIIYGLSFAKMDGLEEYCDPERNFDLRIDNHILYRLDNLIVLGKIERVDIVAYTENDVQNYEQMFLSYKNNNQTKVYENYLKGIFRIVPYKKFVRTRYKNTTLLEIIKGNLSFRM